MFFASIFLQPSKADLFFWVSELKGTVFFFPGNSLHPTHSLDLGEFCIFFPHFLEKKNTNFFPQEKFASHSLEKN